jgi:hypothetical protein
MRQGISIAFEEKIEKEFRGGNAEVLHGLISQYGTKREENPQKRP